MMEAQEFGISPHKSGESLQRLQESYEPPSSSLLMEDGFDHNEINNGDVLDSAVTTNTGILTPLVWRAGSDLSPEVIANGMP